MIRLEEKMSEATETTFIEFSLKPKQNRIEHGREDTETKIIDFD